MKKKSISKAAEDFGCEVDDILEFLDEFWKTKMSDDYTPWIYDLAIIRLYREFEKFMFDCLVALLNKDSSTLSDKTGIDFPIHLNVAVCNYLIIQDGYFDFKGRSGLIRELKKFLPDDHWLIEIVRQEPFKTPLDQLSALRNFAAHDSAVSKKAALKSVNQEKTGSAGGWLKSGNRFVSITKKLKKLAKEIADQADD